MLKKILIGIVCLVALLVVIIMIQPTHFRIERSANMAAPAEQIFAQINDLHQWEAWSPWAKLDPTMKTTYEGEPAGKGAIYRWSGNDEVGEGKMTITESRPSELVGFDLEFIRPFPAQNASEFKITPEGDKTQVTWSLTGDRNFMSKAFGLIVDIDKMVGADFEKGLTQLKTIVESPVSGNVPAANETEGTAAEPTTEGGADNAASSESEPAASGE